MNDRLEPSSPEALLSSNALAGHTSRGAYAAMVAAWGLWSMDSILIHLIGNDFPRQYLVAITLLIGGLSMMVMGRGIFKTVLKLSKHHLMLLGVLVVFSTAGAELLYVSAITHMNPALVSVLLRSQVAFAVILAMLFLGERFGRITASGIVVILVANAGWLIHNLNQVGWGGSIIGWILAISAAVLWSLGTITAKSLVTVIPPTQLVVARLAFAGVLMFILSAATQGIAPLAEVTAGQWGLLIAKGTVTSGMTFFLYFWALKRMKVCIASALEQAAPLITLCVAHFVLMERVSTWDVAFVCVLLIGAGVVVLGSWRERGALPVQATKEVEREAL